MLSKCMFGVLVISNHVAVWQGSSSKGFDTHVAVKLRYFFLKFPGKNCKIILIMKEWIILIMKEPKKKTPKKKTPKYFLYKCLNKAWCNLWWSVYFQYVYLACYSILVRLLWDVFKCQTFVKLTHKEPKQKKPQIQIRLCLPHFAIPLQNQICKNEGPLKKIQVEPSLVQECRCDVMGWDLPVPCPSAVASLGDDKSTENSLGLFTSVCKSYLLLHTQIMV